MVVISYIKDEVERDEFYAAAFMDSGADGVCDCGAPVAPTVVSALPDGFGVTMVLRNPLARRPIRQQRGITLQHRRGGSRDSASPLHGFHDVAA